MHVLWVLAATPAPDNRAEGRRSYMRVIAMTGVYSREPWQVLAISSGDARMTV
jgi:hypothetical protein